MTFASIHKSVSLLMLLALGLVSPAPARADYEPPPAPAAAVEIWRSPLEKHPGVGGWIRNAKQELEYWQDQEKQVTEILARERRRFAYWKGLGTLSGEADSRCQAVFVNAVEGKLDAIRARISQLQGNKAANPRLAQLLALERYLVGELAHEEGLLAYWTAQDDGKNTTARVARASYENSVRIARGNLEEARAQIRVLQSNP
jgi:hypothetical protein